MKPHSLLILVLLASATYAGERASVNYTIPTDTTDAGGVRTTSASYTHDGSVGGIVGVSTVAAPAETAKHGYIGQLYEITGLSLTAASSTVNETATDQLSAWKSLDDLSLLSTPATSVGWSVLGGPVASISSSGLATAGVVFQNTVATVQGNFGGFTANLDLTVLDSIPDNFGAYSGDAIGDSWQVQYFGQSNPNAGPALDPDGDGDSNLYEYHAQLIPTDPSSFLDFKLIPGPNPSQGIPAGQAKLTLSPGKIGTAYTIEYKDSLLDPTWTTLTAIVGADGLLPYMDTGASGARRFYRVTPARTP